MIVYNTLSRKKEEFIPINKDEVLLYSCGLTVYDEPHIGNWSNYIAWDLLVRVLRDAGYKVNHVQNYTDVGHLVSDDDAGEDKLAKSAKLQRKTAWQIADYYIKRAQDGMQALNLSKPTHMPRATDFISQQVEFVAGLETKGYTYIIPDEGVYFDSSKFKDYGQLARLDIDGLRAGERVDIAGKKNPTDFALWKFSPKDEKRDMEWESPWGKGFPGWHLECSAMIRELLGDTIDIHTGGIDHIPVHHTNEIAQSEALTGKKFVNYWLHRNFIKVDGQKMSKSKNNFITLSDIVDKGFDPLDFKMLVLQSSYHTESNFSWDNMDAARARRLSLQAFADLRFQQNQDGITEDDLDRAKKQIQTALHDDLNNSEALAVLSRLENMASSSGVSENANLKSFVYWLDTIYGLDLADSVDIPDNVKQLLKDRQQARDDKDWPKADDVRDALLKQGIEIRDTSFGQVWQRI